MSLRSLSVHKKFQIIDANKSFLILDLFTNSDNGIKDNLL